MGEHILRVALGEITHVRIRCKCGTCLELPIDRLGSVGSVCQSCGQTFYLRNESGSARFDALRVALSDLAEMSEHYTVEFPVRLDGAGK